MRKVAERQFPGGTKNLPRRWLARGNAAGSKAVGGITSGTGLMSSVGSARSRIASESVTVWLPAFAKLPIAGPSLQNYNRMYPEARRLGRQRSVGSAVHRDHLLVALLETRHFQTYRLARHESRPHRSKDSAHYGNRRTQSQFHQAAANPI